MKGCRNGSEYRSQGCGELVSAQKSCLAKCAGLFTMAVIFAPVFVFAEGQGASPAQGSPGLTSFIPLILIFAIFYFLIIRPQQKKTKQHQKFLTDLKRGDRVVTASGIIGTIRTLNEKFVTLEVDDDVCLKVLRGQIADGAASLKEEAKVKAGSTTQMQEEKA